MRNLLCILEVLMDVQSFMLCELQEIIKKVIEFMHVMVFFSIMNRLVDEKLLLLAKSLWQWPGYPSDYKILFIFEILMH